MLAQAASLAARRRVPLLLTAASHALIFRHPGELLFGTMLTYYFRLLERQMGTGKYSAYALVTCGLAYAIEAALSALFQRPSASGPYPLLFANLVAFFLEVPPLQKFTFLGVNVSDKVFVYLAALQLLFSSSQRSLAAGLAGSLAGMLYHWNVLGLRRLRVSLLV